MKIKVVKSFIDRHTCQNHIVGEVLEVSEERYNEIMKTDPTLIEAVKVKERKKKVEDDGTETAESI